MGEVGAWASHCPSSNSALGSGLFPLARHVVARRRCGARAPTSGAGTGLYLPKEGLQAYFMQQLLGPDGLPLAPAHLLYLSTRAGALALGIADRVGDFGVGKEFDAVLWRAPKNSDLGVNLQYAADASDALARIFALATPADVHGVWLKGERVRNKDEPDPRAQEYVA